MTSEVKHQKKRIGDLRGRLADMQAEEDATGETEDLRRNLKNQTLRLQLLRKLDRAILAAVSVEDVVEVVLDHLEELVEFALAEFLIFDEDTQQVSLLTTRWVGVTRTDTRSAAPITISPARRAQFAQGHPVLVKDLRTIPAQGDWFDQLQTVGIRSWAGFPLTARGRLMGVLGVGRREPGPWREDDIDVFCELADQMAIALSQARLVEALQQQAENLETRVELRTTAFRYSEARYRAVFEGVPLGIAILDQEGRMLDSNSALQMMLGCDETALHAQFLTDWLHPDDVSAGKGLLRETANGRRERFKIRQRYRRSNGEMMPADLTASLIRGANGRPRYVVGILDDLTEELMARAALVQAEKLSVTGKLAASLAHDINNPLQAVVGCLSLTEEVLAEGGDATEYLQVARKELARAVRTTRRMRDLLRRSALGERLPSDVNGLLNQALLLTERKFEEQAIEVHWRPAADLPLLPLAADRLQQAFLTILMNALDAMPDGGQLRVQTTRTEHPDGVQIQLADTGIGISSQNLAHLFKPFFTTKTEGLGLGLYSCRNTIEGHGGRIEASNEVGKGTTFTISLPLPSGSLDLVSERSVEKEDK